MSTQITKLLIANRGEIACRVIHTARQMGIATVAVYSQADAGARHTQMADEAVLIGPPPAAESYLRVDRILEACRQTGADAVHPGYGFLAENADFAEALGAAGITFVGPSPASIRAMGLKDAAKRLMIAAGVPVVPGYQGEDQDPAFLAAEAARIGFPVLIKAVAGGGGKGMRRVDDPQQFAEALAGAKREAANSFSDDRVLIEKFLTTPRHIEIQVFGDTHGNVVHLFERDCSLQRRHQKVIEEAPAPGMTQSMRHAMGEAAVKAAQAIDYVGAGTIEFIADVSEGLRDDRFYFMEMNTRLQVEHPVTEAITGQDLVEWQVRVAQGERLPMDQAALNQRTGLLAGAPAGTMAAAGHAIEARLYAEDPDTGFLPAIGQLSLLRGLGIGGHAFCVTVPGRDGLRSDAGVVEGDRVTPYYDPMIAKIIAHGRDRAEAMAVLTEALRATIVEGCRTNRAFLVKCLEHPEFQAGRLDTGFIDRLGPVLLGPIEEVRDSETLAALTPLLLPAVAERLVHPFEREPNRSPWQAMLGFSLWGEDRHPVAVSVNGERLEATLNVRPIAAQVHQLTLTHPSLGSVTVEVDLSGPHPLSRTPNGRWSPVQADTLPDGRLALTTDGRLLIVREGIEGEVDHEALGAEPVIIAELPGTVRAVLVEPGQAVAKDQALMVVEAMKMEHTLRAPRAGTIESLGAAVGDLIAEGTVLVRLAEAEEAPA